jgi:aryl-alcohol dehydrogenase-like predicted oxidoreductase
MIYRRLGKTNMVVSTVALGGSSNCGQRPWASDDPMGYQSMLEKLLELGVNYFDTSQSGGHLSSCYGTEYDFEFLCRPLNRDKVFISTKVDDVSPFGARTAVEGSLSIMNTDYVDLVYIHNGLGVSGTDYGAALACFDVLDDMVAEGKIRFKGMTSHSYELHTGLLNAFADRIDVIMGFCHPIKGGFSGAEGTVEAWESVYRIAESKDVGVVAMKVLISPNDPWSTRETLLRHDPEAWARLQPLVQLGCTVPQACIRWALSNEAVNTAVVGMRTVGEAEEDTAAMNPSFYSAGGYGSGSGGG